MAVTPCNSIAIRDPARSSMSAPQARSNDSMSSQRIPAGAGCRKTEASVMRCLPSRCDDITSRYHLLAACCRYSIAIGLTGEAVP